MIATSESTASLRAKPAAGDREPSFAIYLHWPFCLSKCPYCDFNSHVRERIDPERWRAALAAELRHFAARSGNRRVTSIFFGGGTPSLMPPSCVGALIDEIAKLWPLEAELEITLEANPTSAEAEAFAGFSSAGVNRLSIGVQALDDAALRFLGRDVAEALAAVALARRAVPRVSFDLIYARPGQSPEAWAGELRQALDLNPEHLSLYQLTIEPGTAFEGAWRRGELAMPDESASAALFETTQALLTEAGLPAYEISNHARPGAACRHNLTYWRYGDYVGVGPGAHGRLTEAGTKIATRQHRAPEVWLERVERQGHGTRVETAIDAGERLTEMTLMGLRLSEGIAREAFRRELGSEPEALYPPDRLSSLESGGLLSLDATGLSATQAGRRRLDALLAYLLAA
jgi:putative oxygen-independent coproporphyrinogen III oxidase